MIQNLNLNGVRVSGFIKNPIKARELDHSRLVGWDQAKFEISHPIEEVNVPRQKSYKMTARTRKIMLGIPYEECVKDGLHEPNEIVNSD